MQKINIENYLKNKKKKKREYGRNRYQNMSEENKQRPKKHQKVIVNKKNRIKNSYFFLYVV